MTQTKTTELTFEWHGAVWSVKTDNLAELIGIDKINEICREQAKPENLGKFLTLSIRVQLAGETSNKINVSPKGKSVFLTLEQIKFLAKNWKSDKQLAGTGEVESDNDE